MADISNRTDAIIGLGQPQIREGAGGSGLAIAISLVWVVLALGAFIFLPSTSEGFDSLRFVMMIVAIIVPVAMIWIAIAVTRSAQEAREDSRRLQAAIDTLRQTYLAERQARSGGSGTVERKLNEIAQATRAGESTLATFTSTRETAGRGPSRAKQARPDDQPTLALGTSDEDETPSLTRLDMVRALNFPDTDKDEVGFAALRRALKDRQARNLIQASQDVLTLLSQDGIYMDDLRPDRAKPEVWRRFANGERGRAVAALGGIRDRSCLALAIGRMREDTIFRDAAHHFLRLFDRMLVSFESDATDEEMSDLSETRTARAFMLLGRVTGAFD